jgi:hypothetical protein
MNLHGSTAWFLLALPACAALSWRQNNLLLFSGSDFIVPLSMEGVPHKAARTLVKAGKQGVHFEKVVF